MLYVAFGIFTNGDIIHSLTDGKKENLGRVVISDWKFRWRGCADVEPSEGDSFEGLLWRIDQDTLDSLDTVEGYPNFYNRVIVQTSHGPALMYTMVNKGPLEIPSDHMFAEICVGYNRNGLDTDQLFEALEEVE